MAASEGPNTEPYRMVPALMVSPGVYDERVLDGLDFFMAEIGKRGMKAGDNWLGDPPHEPPGWYSVYNTDESTIRIISSHAKELIQVRNPYRK